MTLKHYTIIGTVATVLALVVTIYVTVMGAESGGDPSTVTVDGGNPGNAAAGAGATQVSGGNSGVVVGGTGNNVQVATAASAAQPTLANRTGSVLVLSGPEVDRFQEPGYQVCQAPNGTPVQVLRTELHGGAFMMSEVAIVAGSHAGKRGWVMHENVHQ